MKAWPGALAHRFAFSDIRALNAAAEPLTWLAEGDLFPPERADVADDGLRRELRQAFRRQQSEMLAGLRAAWLSHLLTTDSLRHERLTLFWHGYFTTEATKAGATALVYRQYRLLHQHATGSFKSLLRAISTDAAMLRYLDGAVSRKTLPNENYARELLELFTLGVGHYSEKDIKEIARALTGWRVSKPDARVVFNPKLHDGGVKTILGRKGAWGLEDVIDILLDQPRLAEHVVERMWREFVSPHPEPVEVKRLARIFRDANYELAPLWDALAHSDVMAREVRKASLIKSPIELVVGTVRQFRLRVGEDASDLVRVAGRMGQTWYAPPNVKGWPGGTAWIDGQTLLARQRWLQAAVAQVRPDRLGHASADSLIRAVMPRAPLQQLPAAADWHELIGLLVQDPVYQLK